MFKRSETPKLYRYRDYTIHYIYIYIYIYISISIHFYYHITTARVLWWVKFLRACTRQCRNNLHIDSTYLQTYQERQCAEYTYIYSVHTVYYLRHTYNYQYTLCTVGTHFTLCTHIHTIVCKKKLQQIIHRPDTQCHECTLHGIQW